MDRINKEKAVEFVLKCLNFDGGFGCIPGAESHSGQVLLKKNTYIFLHLKFNLINKILILKIYCCLGFLSIMNCLHLINVDLLGWWLSERQLESGGLNGRPEKLQDVCYSWWVIASLKIIGKLDWINTEKLKEYILSCQDDETGGFSDRPGNMVI